VQLLKALLHPVVGADSPIASVLGWRHPSAALFSLALVWGLAACDMLHVLPPLLAALLAFRILKVRARRGGLQPIEVILPKESAREKLQNVVGVGKGLQDIVGSANHTLLKLHALMRSDDAVLTNHFLACLLAGAVGAYALLSALPGRYLFAGGPLKP